VDRFARLGETEQKEYIPEYYFHQIELLAHWRYLHSRGKSRGQTEIAGADFADNALIGERHRESQRTKAQKERSSALNAQIEKLLAPQYDDWTNAELWDELISFSNPPKVEIVGDKPRSLLRWEDDQTGKRGNLSYEAFENRLAGLRRAAGTLKRGRKSS